MAALTTDNVVTRGGGLVDAAVDGEVVALNIDKGACYGLNKVGSRIWAMIAEPKRIADICDALVSEYEVDQATCAQQVLGLLEELRAEGMIEVRDEPPTGAR